MTATEDLPLNRIKPPEQQPEQQPEQDWGDVSLMGLFQLESETQVAALNQHLIALEQADTAAVGAHLDALMRAAHSIKGAARIVQVEAAVKVAHALEDCFIAAQQNILTLVGDRIDVLLMGVDLLSKIGALVGEPSSTEQLSTYDADVDDIVIAIEGMVSAAEKALTPTSKRHSPAPEAVHPPAVQASHNTLEVVEATMASSQSTSPAAEIVTEVPETPVDQTNRMIRISAGTLSRLMGLAGELLVESNRLQPFADSLLVAKRQQQSALSLLKEQSEDSVGDAANILQIAHSHVSDHLEEIDQLSRRFGQLSDSLYREVIASHMCAFEEGVQGYKRLVRDTAKHQGKQVSLEIKGLSTQIDRDILSKLDTPITHLLINAITHSIESPDVRLARGKPACSTIKLSAAHRSGLLVVEVEDDGAGIDFVRLRQKIVEKGLVTSAVCAQLSEPELIEFLFLPGFSTASQVDKLAGRGYGLDLARTMAQSVGGALSAHSPVQNSGGTHFQFQLPLTLSVVRSLLFEASGEAYAVSLSRISRVIKLEREQIHYSENRPYFRLEENNISLVSIHQILGTQSLGTQSLGTQSLGTIASSHEATLPDDRLSVVMLGKAGAQYGICVDKILEEKDLVVKPLDPRLGKVPNISAAALGESGVPILILDVADVLRSAEKALVSDLSCQLAANDAVSNSFSTDRLSDRNETQDGPKDGLANAQKKVLVVDDSMTVRAMEKKLLQNKGYAVDIAVDGAEGWNAVRMDCYDLVITDIDMPRMSGIELIRKMREYEATKNLPVIVVSYKDREADQLAGLEAGANYYLTKSSFHNDGLITAVVDLIGS